MTPDQMRTAIAANPQWTAMDALKNLFGTDLTRSHVLQAERYGGMNDRRTIASIPDQVDHYLDMLRREYGLVFAPRIVFPVLSVVAFEKIRWDMGLQHVTSNCLSFGAKSDLRGSVPDTMAYWRDLYQRHLGREPDTEGLAWWLATVEREFIKGIK